LSEYPPALWIPAPHIAANDGSSNNQELPDPDGEKDDPVAPAYCVVQSQWKQQGEQQQAGKYHKFAEIEVNTDQYKDTNKTSILFQSLPIYNCYS